MTKDKAEQLVTKFPILWAHDYPNVGDGWFGILWRLSEKIEPLLQKMPCVCEESGLDIMMDVAGLPAKACQGCKPCVSQNKEKYGMLRFYMTAGYPGELEPLVVAAEAESSRTCEECGRTPAGLVGKSWVQTLCADCAVPKADKVE